MQINGYKLFRKAFVLGISFDVSEVYYPTERKILTVEFLVWGLDISWDTVLP